MAGLSNGLLARFEDGQDIPSLETFDHLAEALGVPVKSFFCGESESENTPRLALRMTLQQIVDEPPRSPMAVIVSLLTPQAFVAASKEMLSIAMNGGFSLNGKKSHFTIPPPDRQVQTLPDPSEDDEDSGPSS
jgi:transcriptional regulator with XRE-family HTH domain